MNQEDEAKIVQFEDPGGNKIKFFSYRGQPMPAFSGDQGLRMRRMGEFRARKDDVYVCGYAKSGGNWTWEMCHMLLTGNAEYYNGNKMMAMLEFVDQEHFNSMSSPRCLSHHFRFEDIPPDVFRKDSKMVYLLRNPKDVCVSHYHHHKGLVGVYDYHGNWPDYFEMWLEGKVDNGKWTTFVKGWEKGIKDHPSAPIHVLCYENLKMNFDKEVRKLAEFLGVKRSEEFFHELSKKCDFETMKKERGKSGYSESQKAIWRNGEIKFLRKGVIGDWKKHFTVAQNEQFDAMLEQEMKDSELEFVFES